MGYGGILGQATNTYTKDQTLTQAIAALYNLGTDAVPNDVFNILSASALYKTVAPTQQLGSLAEGSIIYLNESGTLVPFYVAKQDYEPDYNTNRTLVVRKDAVTQGAWNSSGVNTYDGSTIDTWFNSTYLPTLDNDVQASIGTTNIPYISMGEVTTVQRIDKAVFSLSATELGDEGSEGSILSIAYMLQNNTVGEGQWTRTPQSNSSVGAIFCRNVDKAFVPGTVTSTTRAYRPCFTLPSTFTAYIEEPTTGLYDIQNNLLLALPSGSGTGFAQIETGSYVGTGTYGSSNPNSLTFGFVPEMVFVYRADRGILPGQVCWAESFIYTKNQTYGSIRTIGATGAFSIPFLQSGNTFSWYTEVSDPRIQLNASDVTYNYIAIG